MIANHILHEIRQTRDHLAEGAGYDLKRLFEYAGKREREASVNGVKFVSFAGAATAAGSSVSREEPPAPQPAMPPLRSYTCLAALLLIAGSARATVGESSVFSFDTRDSVSTVVGESGVFTFDTRLVDGLGNDGNSGTFVLDTRAVLAGGLQILGPTSVTGGTQVAYAIQNAGVDRECAVHAGIQPRASVLCGCGWTQLVHLSREHAADGTAAGALQRT